MNAPTAKPKHQFDKLLLDDITAPVKIASGDEWSTWRYRNVDLFDTSCGNAGVYRNDIRIARTLEEAVKIIDKEKGDKADEITITSLHVVDSVSLFRECGSARYAFYEAGFLVWSTTDLEHSGIVAPLDQVRECLVAMVDDPETHSTAMRQISEHMLPRIDKLLARKNTAMVLFREWEKPADTETP